MQARCIVPPPLLGDQEKILLRRTYRLLSGLQVNRSPGSIGKEDVGNDRIAVHYQLLSEKLLRSIEGIGLSRSLLRATPARNHTVELI